MRWDHNGHYHRLVLRQIPTGSQRALDVGCGAGRLASVLARRCVEVVAVDCSETMTSVARRRVPGNVRVVTGDVMDLDLPAESYDAVTCLAVLHHLPLEAALTRIRTALRPGGVLVVLGVPALGGPMDVLQWFAARPADLVMGWLRLVGVRVLPPRMWGRLPAEVTPGLPVRDPDLSIREVRRRTRAILPGARVRRLLFWRYLLVYRRPVVPDAVYRRPVVPDTVYRRPVVPDTVYRRPVVPDVARCEVGPGTVDPQLTC